jgi:hypothetical protein
VASVRENIAQLSSLKATPAEIWGAVHTLESELLLEYKADNVTKVTRNEFGKFFGLKDGAKQKYKYMLEALHGGAERETIETGLRLSHADWCAVRDAVVGAPATGEDDAAKAAIAKCTAVRESKDKPLSAKAIAALETKASLLPEFAELLACVRQGDADGAGAVIRSVAKAKAKAKAEDKAKAKAKAK